MGIVVLVAFVILMIFAQRWVNSGRQARRDRVTPSVLPAGSPAPPAPPADRADPGESERAATARLLAGELDAPAYRTALTVLATQTADMDLIPRMLTERDGPADSSEVLRRLDMVLPEVPIDTVRAAVGLARCGAGADELVRLLHLTGPQALRITTTLSS